MESNLEVKMMFKAKQYQRNSYLYQIISDESKEFRYPSGDII